MRTYLLPLFLLLAGCGGGSSGPYVQTSVQGWTQFYGSGVNVVNGSFDIPPPPGSVHYIVGPATAKLGQTVTLKFQITGSGTWGISGTDTPPPTIHLFLWERGDDLSGQGLYETYREWAGRTEITNPGTYTVSVQLTPSNWTGVLGQTPSLSSFTQLLNNLYGAGFTFGGASFAGHGIYSKTGLFHFQLVSFTIQ